MGKDRAIRVRIGRSGKGSLVEGVRSTSWGIRADGTVGGSPDDHPDPIAHQ